MTLICNTPTPLQTNAQAQPMTEQKVSLPDRAIIGKLTPIAHMQVRKREFEISQKGNSKLYRFSMPTSF